MRDDTGVSTDIEFRPAHADAEPGRGLIALMEAEVEKLYGHPLVAPDMPSATAQQMSPPEGAFLVGYRDGEAICCGGLKRLPDGACEIKRMFVVEHARGAGVARALLRALEDTARRLGYRTARLDTGPAQPSAERMYREAGFRAVADFNDNPLATFWGEKDLGRDLRTVSIPARFNGPPISAHGGYSAAIAGLAIDGPAEVTLHAPPPLETPLTLDVEVDRAVLRDGDTPIATATPTTVDIGAAPVLSPAQARAAMPDPDELRPVHPFPTCFGCGPDRDPSDGLRLFSGPVEDGDGIFAAGWTPRADLAGPDGVVDPAYVWAALDCPSSAPAADPTGERPIVLGRFAIDLRAPVMAGTEHAIVTRALDHQGRRRTNAVWLLDADGRELACGRATWIELKPVDAAARRGDGR